MSKTALITGASSGIGRGTATKLASEGWHILAHGRRKDALQETLELIKGVGGTGDYLTAEMGDMAALANLAKWAMARERLDAFVHCAAKFTYGEVSTERFEDWDVSIDQVLCLTSALMGPNSGI